MASHREMERIRKSPVEFRAMAARLRAGSYMGISLWETDFLADIEDKTYVKEYSLRQAEKLFEIRDKLVPVEKLRNGFSVAILLRRVHEARSDLSQADEDWIVAAWERSQTKVRTGEAGRLLRCAHQLTLIEEADPVIEEVDPA